MISNDRFLACFIECVECVLSIILGRTTEEEYNRRKRKVDWGFDRAKGLIRWFEGNHDPPTADTWDNGPTHAATKEPVGATLALGTALPVQIKHEVVYLKLDYATPQSADIG